MRLDNKNYYYTRLTASFPGQKGMLQINENFWLRHCVLDHCISTNSESYATSLLRNFQVHRHVKVKSSQIKYDFNNG